MVCPWPFADRSKDPPTPHWPDHLRRFDALPGDPLLDSGDQSDSPSANPPHLKKPRSSKAELNAFPRYAHTHTEFVDLRSHLRLTTDGR